MTYLGDASDHVFDERFKGIDRASLLVTTEPHSDADVCALSFLVILFYFLEFYGEMREVLCDLSSFSLHSNRSSPGRYSD